MASSTHSSTILLRRQGAMGDVLWLTPMIETLKNLRPASRIFVQTDVPEVLAGHPKIDGLNILAPEDADEVYDPIYEFTPDSHLMNGYARSTGLAVPAQNPSIHLSADEECRGREILDSLSLSTRPIIGLHAGVSWPERTWQWWKWDMLARRLVDELNVQVVVLGKNPDFQINPWPGVHSLVDCLNLRELLAVIKRLDIFTGIDSGPMHVAAAWHKPIIALFGCILPEWRRPPASPFYPVVADLTCIGCHARRPIPSTEGRCENGTYQCMRDITVDMVFLAVRKALTDSGHDVSARSNASDITWPKEIEPTRHDFRYKVIPSRTGAPSLHLSGNNLGITLNSAFDPESEARRWAKTILPCGDIAVLGLGLGYHVRELLRQANDGRIVVVEADPQIFYQAHAAGIMAEYWDDPRLHLVVSDSPKKAVTKIRLIDTAADFKPVFHRPSLRWRPDVYQPLFDSLNRKWMINHG